MFVDTVYSHNFEHLKNTWYISYIDYLKKVNL